MKKGLLTLILGIALVTTGCVEGTDNSSQATKESDYSEDIFVLEKEWVDSSLNNCSIVYDKDTKVKYFVVSNLYRFGITPLYNADGTLQLHTD